MQVTIGPRRLFKRASNFLPTNVEVECLREPLEEHFGLTNITQGMANFHVGSGTGQNWSGVLDAQVVEMQMTAQMNRKCSRTLKWATFGGTPHFLLQLFGRKSPFPFEQKFIFSFVGPVRL